MDKIKLELTPKDLDYIASALAQRPYIEVQALLANMQEQVTLQQPLRPSPESE